MQSRHGLIPAVLFLIGACFTTPIWAQSTSGFPTRPVRIVVPYPPGTYPDVVGRIVGEAARKLLGQPIIFENKPSAGGIVAAQTVAQSVPDGYTLLLYDAQIWAIDALIYKTIPFNPATDFVPLTTVASAPVILGIGPSMPTSTDWPMLLAHLKENPGKYSYASAGIGSILHFLMEMLKAKTGIDVQHVPFRGLPQYLPSIAAGEIGIFFTSTSAIPAIEKAGGRLVALTGRHRMPEYPNVPTLTELGVAGMEVSGDIGLAAPRNTPDKITDQLTAAFREAQQDPDVIKKLGALATQTGGLNQQEFMSLIKADIERYTNAAKLADITPQ